MDLIELVDGATLPPAHPRGLRGRLVRLGLPHRLSGEPAGDG
ncbi:hypothetical protein [Nocardioides convexus]|nr:hypothetical protein [Nocardioides convexus]